MASASDIALPARLIALVTRAMVVLCLLVACNGGNTVLATGAGAPWSASMQAAAPAQSGTPVPVAIDSSAHGAQRGEAEPEAERGNAAPVSRLHGWAPGTSAAGPAAITRTGLPFAPRLRRLPPSQAPPQLA